MQEFELSQEDQQEIDRAVPEETRCYEENLPTERRISPA